MSIATEISNTAPPERKGENPAVGAIAGIVAKLRASFDEGATRSLDWRLRQLDGVSRFVEACHDDILDALAKDLGKPNFEGFLTEIAYTQTELAHMRKHLSSWMKPERVSTPMVAQPGTSRIHKDPLGVVLNIAPWNYPFQLAIGPALGAIAAGNCVIIKPSEVAANTSKLLAERLPEFVDQSCVQVVEGGVAETTALLEQRFDHIFYTGNGHVGRIVMTAAAKNLTPVTLELGGKSPCIIDREVDLEVALRRIAWGKWSNAGQTCVAPDYVLAHQDIFDRVVAGLGDTIREFYGDNPQNSEDYGRIINERHHRRLMGLMEGVTVAHGGQNEEADRYIAPTVLSDVHEDSPCMGQEIFGPLLPIIPITDIEHAVRFINARPKPLALYVFTKSRRTQEQVVSRTSSGGLTVNHAWMHLAVPGLPFGGVGESGMGAYHGRLTFDTFTHRKAVLSKPTMLDPAFAYPPYDDKKKKIVKLLM